MIPSHWSPYRRAVDDELVGYLSSEPDGTVPRTVFGYALAEAGERSEAAAVLEHRGLASLAEPWLLREPDGTQVRVAVLAAFPERVLVSPAPYGFVDPTATTVVLDVPAGARRLAPLS